MIDDDDISRKPPQASYRATEALLEVPQNVLAATLSSLRRSGPLESAVFWYGTRSGDEGRVTAVVTPEQGMARGNYHVSATAMSEMVNVLEDGWKPLAQVHSHPGRWVEHSTYDDLMASSRKALSIVFPFYGHYSEQWPAGVGIHEWQNDYWHLLDARLAANRVRLTTHRTAFIKDFRR